MKKLTALLLALCLLLPAAALAETAPQLEKLNFGDFNLTMDPAMSYAGLEEKNDGEVWFTLFPAYQTTGDESITLNVVWMANTDASVQDLYTGDNDAFAAYIRSTVEPGFLENGFTMADFSVPAVQIVQVDGVDMLVYLISMVIDYSDQQFSMLQMQAIAIGSFGTYIFTGTASTMEELNAYIIPILDSLTWN